MKRVLLIGAVGLFLAPEQQQTRAFGLKAPLSSRTQRHGSCSGSSISGRTSCSSSGSRSRGGQASSWRTSPPAWPQSSRRRGRGYGGSICSSKLLAREGDTDDDLEDGEGPKGKGKGKGEEGQGEEEDMMTKLFKARAEAAKAEGPEAVRAYQEYYNPRAQQVMKDMGQGITPAAMRDDFTIDRRQFIVLPLITLAGLGFYAFSQRVGALKGYFSIQELGHPLDSRTVRKPLTRKEYVRVIEKAEAEGVSKLPQVPWALPGKTSFLLGSADKLTAELEEGRIAVYHFWRASNRDSMAALRVVNELATRYAGQVVVVSVHSPKFDDDAREESAALALLQEGLTAFPSSHYVVHDADRALWKEQGVDDWPAVVVTVPQEGQGQRSQAALFAALGERPAAGPFAKDAVGVAVRYYSGVGGVGRKAVPTKPFLAPTAVATVTEVAEPSASLIKAQRRIEGSEGSPSGPLNFASGVAVDVKRDRLYVADTFNNRVLVCTLEGRYLGCVGDEKGVAGLADGNAAASRFDRPRGVAIDKSNQVLWVVDSGNAAVRRVVLGAKGEGGGPSAEGALVKTIRPGGLNLSRSEEDKDILDSNQIMEDLERSLRSKGRALEGGNTLGYSRGLREPWAIALQDSFVYVTAAGTNQVWQLDSTGSDMTPIAGSGRLGRRDSKATDFKLSDQTSRFAQPMGLAATSGKVFVADSESGAIRRIDFIDNTISTQFGGDKLFTENMNSFGDKDGLGPDVRLQGPQGLAYIGSKRLLLADTLNHKLKILKTNTDAPSCDKYAGTGEPGLRDGPLRAAQFYHPGAVAASADAKRAWVCDIGNNALRAVDLEKGEVTTVKLQGVPAVAAGVGRRT